MPRLPRIQLEGAIYYVTAKGLGSETIFKDKADYRMYLDLVNKYKGQHKFRLYSYCLLPDCLHLLIETGDDATISEIMHDLNSLYTKYFNGRYGKKGHLFEARFKSVLVEKINYLLSVSRYIHNLPGDKAHPYTSFHIYTYNPANAEKPALDLSEEIKEIKEFLAKKESALSYEKYCLTDDVAEQKELDKKLSRGGIVGSEEFVRAARERVRQHVEEKEEAGKAKGPNRILVVFIGAAVIVATASSIYLYVSRQTLENRYEALLGEREAEYTEKTRFENRSPIAPAELSGTEWELEIIPLAAESGEQTFKDVVRFSGNTFNSDYFGQRGYGKTNFTFTTQGNDVVVWNAVLLNVGGDKVSWRGNWSGDAMKGVVSIQSAGSAPRNFSFYGVKWTYTKSTPTNLISR